MASKPERLTAVFARLRAHYAAAEERYLRYDDLLKQGHGDRLEQLFYRSTGIDIVRFIDDLLKRSCPEIAFSAEVDGPGAVPQDLAEAALVALEEMAQACEETLAMTYEEIVALRVQMANSPDVLDSVE